MAVAVAVAVLPDSQASRRCSEAKAPALHLRTVALKRAKALQAKAAGRLVLQRAPEVPQTLLPWALVSQVQVLQGQKPQAQVLLGQNPQAQDRQPLMQALIQARQVAVPLDSYH